MTTVGKGQSGDNQLYWVAENIIASDFPDVNSALRDPDGLLAIGGDLTPGRLIDAYTRGIFPWYSKGQPILWWSPDPRCILELDELNVSRSLKKTLRKKMFRVTFNQDFEGVIRACADARWGSTETWITQEMMEAYLEMFKLNYALSVECWYEGRLMGGLYGIVIGKIFFGESMFSWKSDASKVALVHLIEQLKSRGFRLIDCQVHSRHLQSLGAKPIPRKLFVNILDHCCHEEFLPDWPIEIILK